MPKVLSSSPPPILNKFRSTPDAGRGRQKGQWNDIAGDANMRYLIEWDPPKNKDN